MRNLRSAYLLCTLVLGLCFLVGPVQQAQTAPDAGSTAPPAPVFNAEATPLPVIVLPTNPCIRYVGRFNLREAAGPRCAWSASSIFLRFLGTALNVRVNESANDDEYQVELDGKASAVLVPRSGTHLYSVFQSSKSGTHTVRLVKRTEAFFGTTQFLGFQLSEGGRMLTQPAPHARRLEIIGDSISCGYGNEAKDQHERFSSTTENAYLSYGAMAARSLGAEYVCLAWSGRTMWPKNTMGEIYDLVLPLDPGSQWDFSRWTPDVVIINLSTNDFGAGTPDQKGWTSAYEAFLTRVRRNYPHAALYCATSPMMGGKEGAIARSYLTQIVADENAAGDKDVRLLIFETQDGKNGFGSDWHPSLKTHQIMADKLAATLRRDLGWNR